MIDLHMHTTYSDGSKTVEELLKMCEKRKLDYISITDHNTCEAYFDEKLINNKIFKGKIIRGCELGANFQNRAIEILAYNIDIKLIKKYIENYYSETRVKKTIIKIYKKFIQILNKKDIKYNINNIIIPKDNKKFVETIIYEEIIRYPENEKILGKEYFTSHGLFIRKELSNPNSEYFLDRVSSYPSAKEIVDMIHEIKGKAFFAHPFEYKFDNTMQYIKDLIKETELDGIECFHPSADDHNTKILIEFANKNNLYISGGSDYHGKPKPDIEIGIGKGNMFIQNKIIEDWNK